VIVIITNEGEEIKQILSDMEKHVRFTIGASEDSLAEDVCDRQYINQFNRYYVVVIACLRETETIQLFGPGEASSLSDCLTLSGLIYRGSERGNPSPSNIMPKFWLP